MPSSDALSYFVTPANEASFSSVIDEVIHLTGQVQSIAAIVEYANAVIREGEGRALFFRSLEELEITGADGVTVWPIPPGFRRIETVRYGQQGVYPDYVLPGRAIDGKRWFYYSAGGSLIFQGTVLGEPIQIAYYKWQPPLGYFLRLSAKTSLVNSGMVDATARVRAAYYDTSTEMWMYLNAEGNAYVTALGNEVAEAAARKLNSNWLALTYRDAIVAGVRSMIATSMGDTTKSAPYFSQYRTWLSFLDNTGGDPARFGNVGP